MQFKDVKIGQTFKTSNGRLSRKMSEDMAMSLVPILCGMDFQESVDNVEFSMKPTDHVYGVEGDQPTPVEWFMSQVCHGGLVSKGHLKETYIKAENMFKEAIEAAYKTGVAEAPYGHVEEAAKAYFKEIYGDMTE